MGGAMKILFLIARKSKLVGDFPVGRRPGIYEIYRKGGAECARWACLGWAREY